MKHTMLGVHVVAVLMPLVLSGCQSIATLNPFAAGQPGIPSQLAEKKDLQTLSVLWRHTVGAIDGALSQPAVVDGSVYVSTLGGRISKLADGVEEWHLDLALPISAGLGVSKSKVFAASPRGDIVAIDAIAGRELWRTNIGGQVLAAPVSGNDVVVTQTTDSRAVGIEVHTGKIVWTIQRPSPPLTLRSAGSLAIDGDLVLIGFPSGKLIAATLANGQAIWESTVSFPKGATELERVSDVVGPAIGTDGKVCAAAYLGSATCFDRRTGASIWTKQLLSTTGISGGSSGFVAASQDGELISLTTDSGASTWKQSVLVGRRLTRPAVLRDSVVVGDSAGNVYCLDYKAGAIVALNSVSKEPIVSLTRLDDRRVLVQDGSGTITALDVGATR